MSRELTLDVLHRMPWSDEKLVFVLCRFQGMRREEAFNLRWCDVDWERNRIECNAEDKTGWRECPIFPETLPYLQQAFDDAPDGAVKVLRKFNDVESVTDLVRRSVIAAIGKPRMWPAVLQRLRKTRRNELENELPKHVDNEWLGHDKDTADKYYLQVMPEHWEQALKLHTLCPDQKSGNKSGNTHTITDAHPQSIETTECENARGSAGMPLCDLDSVPPSRAELPQRNTAKAQVFRYAGNTAGNRADRTELLLRLWGDLDSDGRTELLALAKRLSTKPGAVRQ